MKGIKLNRSQLVDLTATFYYLLSNYQAYGIGELVREVMIEWVVDLQKKLNNPEQMKFTIRLTSPQSLAFILLTNADLDCTDFTWVTIREIRHHIFQHKYNQPF